MEYTCTVSHTLKLQVRVTLFLEWFMPNACIRVFNESDFHSFRVKQNNHSNHEYRKLLVRLTITHLQPHQQNLTQQYDKTWLIT